jgi:hypothetical protein
LIARAVKTSMHPFRCNQVVDATKWCCDGIAGCIYNADQ